MLHRTAISFLLITLCVVGAPWHTRATRTDASLPVQDQPLTISTTEVIQPGGGTVTNLTGRYQKGDRVVNLRAFTVKTEKSSIVGPPSPNSPEAATEEGYQPNADYYYSDSEMTKSDGTVMVEAVYEYEQPTSRSVLYITLGGVTLTFDLNTQEAVPISDSDQQRLDA